MQRAMCTPRRGRTVKGLSRDCGLLCSSVEARHRRAHVQEAEPQQPAAEVLSSSLMERTGCRVVQLVW